MFLILVVCLSFFFISTIANSFSYSFTRQFFDLVFILVLFWFDSNEIEFYEANFLQRPAQKYWLLNDVYERMPSGTVWRAPRILNHHWTLQFVCFCRNSPVRQHTFTIFVRCERSYVYWLVLEIFFSFVGAPNLRNVFNQNHIKKTHRESNMYNCHLLFNYMG